MRGRFEILLQIAGVRDAEDCAGIRQVKIAWRARGGQLLALICEAEMELIKTFLLAVYALQLLQLRCFLDAEGSLRNPIGHVDFDFLRRS